ncbi:TIGR00366 family protein, partial [Intestinimonas massiliensis]
AMQARPASMPILLAAGITMGPCTAIAWGDQWTNMIQPFWALPALGVAGLSAKDIMTSISAPPQPIGSGHFRISLLFPFPSAPFC